MAIYERGLVVLLLSLALTRVAADGVSFQGRGIKYIVLKCYEVDYPFSPICKNNRNKFTCNWAT